MQCDRGDLETGEVGKGCDHGLAGGDDSKHPGSRQRS